MPNDEEGYATVADWQHRAGLAEADAERKGASLHAALAQVRGLEGDVRYLRAQLADQDAVKERLIESQDDLQRRLGIAEQRKAEAERMLAVGQRQLDLLQATEEPEKFVDLPELPDAFIRLAIAALERFAEGYAEYGPGAADPLGLAGQWGDLHRKIMKLKRPLWNGEAGTLTRESEQVVLEDIIGHCLLALDMLNRGFEGGK